MVRCGNHRTRPTQADNLHLDIWYQGDNLFHDGGSYRYNTAESDSKYFRGTNSHNTVMLGDFDQMEKGPRFVWYHWTQCEFAQCSENEDWLVFVTTDHGRRVSDGKGHGGQSEREKTIWISTNLKKPNKYFYAVQPAVVDILPSIADHMEIDIPREHQMELDGVSLLNDISISHPEATILGDELLVSWEPYHGEDTVKIWLAETNHFSFGGKDEYQLLGEVPILKRSHSVLLKKTKSKFFKVVIEGKHNSVNRWVNRD